MTLFSEVYEDFLSKITEDMYISWTQEETYNDIEVFLKTAILRFTLPKNDLKDYDLEYSDEDNFSRGRFNVTLTYEEINILSSLMIIVWLQRQLSDSSLTKLNYTGADAKVMNIGGQIEGLKKLIEIFKNQLKEDKNTYYSIDRKDGKDIVARKKLFGKNNE